MKKRKIIIIGAISFLILAVLIVAFLIKQQSDNNKIISKMSLEQVKEKFDEDIQELKQGEYENLVYHDFEVDISDVKKLCVFEIERDNSYKENTFLENFEKMEKVINVFFQEEFDKSYLVVDFYISDSETIYVEYDDIKDECTDEKYNNPRAEFLFGNNTSEGGYMIQITEALNNAWFSKYGLKDILPSQCEDKKVYTYIQCDRQEDIELNLLDGKVLLSDMEGKVLKFLNDDFPLPTSEGISYGIAQAMVIKNGEYEGICFKTRRIYEGVPFEYGATSSSNMYIDEMANDRGEVTFVDNKTPDTMLAFGQTGGKVIEKTDVYNIISLGNALSILSESIGEKSIYDVYGVELIYRNSEIPQEREDEVTDILVPKWKIITINQNDNKYTLFYIDVETGEITERFEYYYG